MRGKKTAITASHLYKPPTARKPVTHPFGSIPLKSGAVPSMGGLLTTAPVHPGYPTPSPYPTPPSYPVGDSTGPPITQPKREVEILERIAVALETIVERFC